MSEPSEPPNTIASIIRSEQEIFADIAALCRSPGFAHAIAWICFNDNVIPIVNDLTSKDLIRFYSDSRLIRTEISTLIGLLVQGDFDLTLPDPDIMQAYIDRARKLLEELHSVLASGIQIDPEQLSDPQYNPIVSGKALREAIFYSSESAYTFQYRDLAPDRYQEDDNWLRSNKGFSISEARIVLQSIFGFQAGKLMTNLREMREKEPGQWTHLSGFVFTTPDIVQVSGLDAKVVDSVLNAFAMTPSLSNTGFNALTDFNHTNASPLLRMQDGSFLLYQVYSLAEALYESPFYWMWDDENYRAELTEHRGKFTEDFCRMRLERIFGADRVYANVDIVESSRRRAGEIDVLVIFGGRAIVVQAKSKRLTLEARKGNDGQIQVDFRKSVQDSYDQALRCAKLLKDFQCELIEPRGRDIQVPHDLKEVYILCAISDHYPSLALQVHEFLRYETSESIKPPLVLDVFALDAITEMLESPLRFLSYISRRVNYTNQVFASHELTVLSYHLKKNLWIGDQNTSLMLHDDIAADLDVAMAVRRDGVDGQRTPDGILTRFSAGELGQIINEIEAADDPGAIELGFFLLTLNEETFVDVSRGIRKITELTARDHKHHDLTIGVGSASCGLTVHCNDDPQEVAASRLQRHCERRKYSQRANRWFGVCIRPKHMSLRFGISLEYEWRPDSKMGEETRNLPQASNLSEAIALQAQSGKVGRNDPCPCGSGKKYKKCCMRKAPKR